MTIASQPKYSQQYAIPNVHLKTFKKRVGTLVTNQRLILMTWEFFSNDEKHHIFRLNLKSVVQNSEYKTD